MSILLDRVLSLIDSKYQTDKEFEIEFGISRSTVSSWRKGKLKSYEKMAPEIADFFNVSLDWLSGIEQKNKPTVPTNNELNDLYDLLNHENKQKILELARLYLAGQDKK